LEYHKDMPWPALPYEDRQTQRYVSFFGFVTFGIVKSICDFENMHIQFLGLSASHVVSHDLHRTLRERFDCQSIPCLVLLNRDGQVLRKDGREIMAELGPDAFPFTPTGTVCRTLICVTVCVCVHLCKTVGLCVCVSVRAHVW
jgi:hypothetical protein